LLAFPDSEATLSLQMDASNKKIDAVSQQRSNEMVQPLSFFSLKEGNLLYAAIKHVRFIKREKFLYYCRSQALGVCV